METWKDAYILFLKAGRPEEQSRSDADKLYPEASEDEKSAVIQEIKQSQQTNTNTNFNVQVVDFTKLSPADQLGYIDKRVNELVKQRMKEKLDRGDNTATTETQTNADQAVYDLIEARKQLDAERASLRRGGGYEMRDVEQATKGGYQITMKQLNESTTADPEIKEWQEKNDQFCYIMPVLAAQERCTISELPSRWYGPLKAKWEAHQYHTKSLSKALSTSTDAAWIPVNMSARLIEDLHLEARVPALFFSQQMTSPTFEVPMEIGLPTITRGTEPTTANPTNLANASSFDTSKLTFSAKLLVAQIPWSYEMDEDSIVALLPRVNMGIVRAFNLTFEDIILNGDTAATHMDSNITGTTPAVTAVLGLRAYAIDNSSSMTQNFSNGALTDALFFSTKKLMGKYGVVPENMAVITSTNVYQDAVALSIFRTAEKFPLPTNVTGVLATYDGAPVLVSEKHREDLNASGVYDGVTTDRRGLTIVHRPSWEWGIRREILIEAERKPSTGQVIQYVSWRGDFQHAQKSGRTTVAFGYNIA